MLVEDLKILLLSVVCFGYLHAKDEITIQIADGKIKGRARVNINNISFYSFQGIPYAQPPVNRLRFQAPVPVEPWEEVRDATREGNICLQVTKDFVNESEDCLFINVFTPVVPSSEFTLPVMFFIHGGGFAEGSSEEIIYGPNHLMEYSVVLVSINYRLGPFGFLSTGDDAIPGNAGLKDQNLALQWVQRNIANFGGDPDRITIFGQSAGSGSVGYQILSPLSAGLFRGAIEESGSPLSTWAYQKDQVNITYQTAGYINPDIVNASSTEFLEYLLGVPAKDIMDAAYHISASTESPSYEQVQQGLFYAPIIEHEHEGAFLTMSMFELLRRGDFNRVPLLIGFNSEETYIYNMLPGFLENLTISFDENNEGLIPRNMHISANNRAQAAKEIKEFYVGTSSFAENQLQFLKYYSDECYVRSIIKHASLQSAFTDVYFYRFAYKGILGGFVNESADGFSDNVVHGEEVSYIFSHNIEGLNTTDLTKYPEQDQMVSKRLITLFTNFAKTLNPTPQPDELLETIIWPKLNATDFAYLDIGSSSEIKYHPREPNYHEWEAIYYRYGVPPYYTY